MKKEKNGKKDTPFFQNFPKFSKNFPKEIHRIANFVVLIGPPVYIDFQKKYIEFVLLLFFLFVT